MADTSLLGSINGADPQGILGAMINHGLGLARSIVPQVGAAPMVPGMAKPSLVVARKMPGGAIMYGKPGQLHSDLLGEDEHVPNYSDLGFALPGGKFLTRSQATAYVNSKEPDIASYLFRPDLSLHANEYNGAAQGQIINQ